VSFPEPYPNPGGDLGYFHRVGQPSTVEITFRDPEHLGFRLQPPESSGMDDSGTIAIKRSAIVLVSNRLGYDGTATGLPVFWMEWHR
jgi:hypothetical protein